MTVTYYLIGYDQRTDLATQFHEVDEADLGTAMKIAGLTPEIAAYYGDWPLTDKAAADIAALAGATLDPACSGWVLGPMAETIETGKLAAE